MRRLSALVLLFTSTLLLAYVSIHDILDAWAGSDVKLLARIVETSPRQESIYSAKNSDLSSDFFPQFERSHNIDSVPNTCVDDYSRSTLSFRLASLYSLRPRTILEKKREIPLPKSAITGLFESAERGRADARSNNLDSVEVSRRAQLAKNAAEQRIFCSPTDGNAWLWRAVLLSKFFADQQRSVISYQFSYWLAPAEKWVMDQRSRFVGELISAGAQELVVEFLAEIGRIVRCFPVDEAAAVYFDAGPGVRAAFAKEVLKAPSRRQRLIADTLDRLGLTIQ
jgi:hypothetical protein